MLLMALRGEFGDVPDVAIFADTGAEPAYVYAHLEWLEKQVAPFEIIRCSAGNLRDDVLRSAKEKSRCSNPPFFAASADGGMLFRNCTRDYKVRPLDRLTRSLMKERGHSRAEKWLGISLDEVQRMRDSQDKRFTNRYPLIEKRLSRNDCLAWMERNGFPRPPKSACTFCPYRSNQAWSEMKAKHPEDFADAVAVDAAIRNGIGGTNTRLFVHSSMMPLGEIKFTLEEHGQASLWGNECEGMCGV